MQRIHHKMTIEEYHSLPMKPGWKYEYYDNQAHIRPGSAIVSVVVPVEMRSFSCPLLLRPVTPEDVPKLRTAYFVGFRDGDDFYGWTQENIRKMAREDIQKQFAGKKGNPMMASRAAIVGKGNASKIAGAALLLRDACGPHLNLLFVRPEWRRQGIATALVSAALNELYTAGEARLHSAHLLANETSGLWHRQFGFVEEPDLWVTRSRLSCVRREIERRENTGDFPAEERATLEAQCRQLTAQYKNLVEIEEQEGPEAVMPWYHREKRCREERI